MPLKNLLALGLLGATELAAAELALSSRRVALARAERLTVFSVAAAETFTRGDHAFSPGVGALFMVTGAGVGGESKPALSFKWDYPSFRFNLLGAENAATTNLTLAIDWFALRAGADYFRTAETQLPLDIAVRPWQVFEFYIGYEPRLAHFRAGATLGWGEVVSLGATIRFAERESFVDFSASARLDFSKPALTDASAILPHARIERKEKKPREMPAFATLVKWGLTPVNALKLSREKNICALDALSRAALEKHHWRCNDHE